MPVIGVPDVPDPAAPVPAAEQRTVAPRVTTVYEVPASEKLRSIGVVAGPHPVVRWTMVDRDGRPVDLTTLYGLAPVLSSAGSSASSASSASSMALVGDDDWALAAPTVTLRTREKVGGMVFSEFTAAILDSVAGTVESEIDPTAMGGPGIYLAEFGVTIAGSTIPTMTNPFLLTVDPGLFGGVPLTGPPTRAEIRLHLRDSSPAEHRLIDTITFDDAELAACVARAVDFWNDALPPVAPFTTHNFPFRFRWLEGIKANLFWIAAEYYRKNHLQYQAAGVAVDDLNKAEEYERKASQIWDAYEKWVQARKIALNIEDGYGIELSAYSYLSG